MYHIIDLIRMCNRQRLHAEFCTLVNINDKSQNVFFGIILLRILTIILLYMIGPCIEAMDNHSIFNAFAKFVSEFKILCDYIFIFFCLSQSNWINYYNQVIAAYYKIIASGSILTILYSVTIFLVALDTKNYKSTPFVHDILTIGGAISIGLCTIDLILIGLMFYFKQRSMNNDQYNNLSNNAV